eukprot:4594981-Pleurochrysis_carterae.AAC.1
MRLALPSALHHQILLGMGLSYTFLRPVPLENRKQQIGAVCLILALVRGLAASIRLWHERAAPPHEA